MSQNKALYCIVATLLILCIPCNAAPGWSDWNNSKDNSTYYPNLNYSESIQFNVTADEVITGYHWWKDGVVISNDWNNYTTSFTSGTHNISVIATSASGNTSMLTFRPVVYREVAVATVGSINETPYADMMVAVDENDFEGYFGAVTNVFTNVMGSVFYLLLFGIYFVMIWIRQESASMPMVLGFVLGAVLLGYVTESFVQGGIVLLVIGATAVFYSLFKERR